MTHEEYYAPPPKKDKQLSPREIVARDRATKYSDEEIRNFIADYRFEGAQARIAYNNMIDQRTWAAERSWRGK